MWYVYSREAHFSQNKEILERSEGRTKQFAMGTVVAGHESVWLLALEAELWERIKMKSTSTPRERDDSKEFKMLIRNKIILNFKLWIQKHEWLHSNKIHRLLPMCNNVPYVQQFFEKFMFCLGDIWFPNL